MPENQAVFLFSDCGLLKWWQESPSVPNKMWVGSYWWVALYQYSETAKPPTFSLGNVWQKIVGRKACKAGRLGTYM